VMAESRSAPWSWWPRGGNILLFCVFVSHFSHLLGNGNSSWCTICDKGWVSWYLQSDKNNTWHVVGAFVCYTESSPRKNLKSLSGTVDLDAYL
jgi:hypothetical protein